MIQQKELRFVAGKQVVFNKYQQLLLLQVNKHFKNQYSQFTSIRIKNGTKINNLPSPQSFTYSTVVPLYNLGENHGD